MTDEDERKAITEVMQRLLAGKPPRRDRRPDREDQDSERGTRPVPDGERDLRASNERPHHRERQPPPGHRETQIIQRHITAVPTLNLPRSVKPPFRIAPPAACAASG